MKIQAKLAIIDPETYDAEIKETLLEVEESLLDECSFKESIVISYFRQKFDNPDKYYKQYTIGVINYEYKN